jgi:hypothetical protein
LYLDQQLIYFLLPCLLFLFGENNGLSHVRSGFLR